MKDYNNRVEALEGLKAEGYVEDFNLKENCLECRAGHYQLLHDEFQVDSSHRFEGDTSAPDDQSVVYAISSPTHELKGTLVSSYGMYTDTVTNEIIEKLR
ncbi:MAG: phosphoribosylpyrophosphate synthetase [Haliscomenobacter sp.]|nr:phosphoribosylpyrophosphate synthetase [Haliscomenobacter sp.]MBK9488300.1 phosphoribosylpyrophosphate synthetase [Haliscomenobacter sp.]